MTEDHGFDINPGDDDFVAKCDCKPACSTYVCTACKERKPFCNGGDEIILGPCDECWQDEQVDKCGCRASWCPCEGPKTGYMGE